VRHGRGLFAHVRRDQVVTQEAYSSRDPSVTTGTSVANIAPKTHDELVVAVELENRASSLARRLRPATSPTSVPARNGSTLST